MTLSPSSPVRPAPFHRNKHGQLKPCRAVQRACRYREHYASKEDFLNNITSSLGGAVSASSAGMPAEFIEWANGMPGSEYPVYHDYGIRILDTVSGLLMDEDVRRIASARRKSLTTSGRAGSSVFEDIVIPVIEEQLAAKPERFAEFGEVSFLNQKRFMDLMGVADKGDARARLFADCAFTLVEKDTGRKMLFPVNIKATDGGTADNVGGWAAMEYACLGQVGRPARRGDVLGRVMKPGALEEAPASDYFLLSFTKGKEGEEMYTKADGFSLLQFKFSAYTFNLTQSFPVQANTSKLFANQGNKFAEDVSILNRRKLWLKDLNTAMINKIESDLALYKSYRDSLD